jgi:FAD/FMN-containing dehydrogenase
VQIVRDTQALFFGRCALNEMAFDANTNIATVGPSVTIKALKLFLLDKGRRLVNSGNYMAQTAIGAMLTGTHGYGPGAVMADAIVALTFLDAQGQPVTLRREDADFPFVALSFGTIGPIVSVSIETAPLESFQSDAWICRLSQKPARAAGASAVSYAVLPYTRPEDPTILLHTLRPPALAGAAVQSGPPMFSLRRIAEFIIQRYQAFDKFLPAFRRPMQKWIARLDIQVHRQQLTDPKDLDYLYDPAPKLEGERSPNLLKGFFSTTLTAYNLAFFVPRADAAAVIRFIMNEAEELRGLGFYLKSLIGVREIEGRSPLPFSANAEGPVSAIDLFADVRDYAWLERIQRDVLDYFRGVRPHWGKSAIVEEYRHSFKADDLDRLRGLHRRHYPEGSLVVSERVRKFLGLGSPDPGSNIAKAVQSTRDAKIAQDIAALAAAAAPAPVSSGA